MKEKAPKQKSPYTGPERRSEPRVFKRNIGQAKLYIISIACLITIGGWLIFALTPTASISQTTTTHQIAIIVPTSPPLQPSFPSAHQDNVWEMSEHEEGNEQLQP